MIAVLLWGLGYSPDLCKDIAPILQEAVDQRLLRKDEVTKILDRCLTKSDTLPR